MFTHSGLYRASLIQTAKEISAEGGVVLVTGASGLIGTCLIDVLLQANDCFNKSFFIYAIGRDKEKLAKRFENNPHLITKAQSITEPIDFEGVNYIIHAASNADPRSYALYPVETMLTNFVGAKMVLDYCRHHHARALLTSSFEIYGKKNQDEYRENDYGYIDLDLIRSCYPESKRAAELLFKSYHDEYSVDCSIVRLSSVYGPTMQTNDSKAHAQFIRNALSGSNIVLKSPGTQKRTYSYVFDAVSAILTVLFKGKSGATYNAANGQSVCTIAEFAQLVAELAGTKVVFQSPSAIEQKGFSAPQNCVLMTEKLESLGWKGKYGLRAGIGETLSILREQENRA